MEKTLPQGAWFVVEKGHEWQDGAKSLRGQVSMKDHLGGGSHFKEA